MEIMLICGLSLVRVPDGLEDVSTYPKLVEELLRRGYSDEEASKVVGKNLITAMEKMEQVKRWPQNQSQNCHDVREQDVHAICRPMIRNRFPEMNCRWFAKIGVTSSKSFPEQFQNGFC